VIIVYYSGHGQISNLGNSFMKLTTGENPIDFDEICRSLSIRPNTQVFGLFDACRTFIQVKGDKKKMIGNYHILYAS
jgi:hypothetical protein